MVDNWPCKKRKTCVWPVRKTRSSRNDGRIDDGLVNRLELVVASCRFSTFRSNRGPILDHLTLDLFWCVLIAGRLPAGPEFQSGRGGCNLLSMAVKKKRTLMIVFQNFHPFVVRTIAAGQHQTGENKQLYLRHDKARQQLRPYANFSRSTRPLLSSSSSIFDLSPLFFIRVKKSASQCWIG